MKKLLLLLAVAGTTIYASAQTLPKPSPGAEVEQIIGATEVQFEYSRPGVKDRTIFGDLVPFDKMWRLGANSPTTISTDHPLFFGDQELKAGTYAVIAVPGKESWKIMFNSDETASPDSYNEKMTVATVEGKVMENSFTESFFIGFDHIKDESAHIVIMWENTKVAIPFKVNTKENAMKNIEAAIAEGDDLESVYSNAANYYYGSLKDYDMALKYADMSLKLGENYGNLFLKARIMNEMDNKKDAIKLAKKASKLAEKNASVGYQNFIKGTLERWSK